MVRIAKGLSHGEDDARHSYVSYSILYLVRILSGVAALLGSLSSS